MRYAPDWHVLGLTLISTFGFQHVTPSLRFLSCRVDFLKARPTHHCHFGSLEIKFRYSKFCNVKRKVCSAESAAYVEAERQ
jgi:hypothetical protein